MSFLVLDDTTNKPVGTVRLVPKKGKLTRLAVLKDYRKYGLGKTLVQALEAHVAAGGEDVQHLIHEVDGKKVATVKIHSQVSLLSSFLTRLVSGSLALLLTPHCEVDEHRETGWSDSRTAETV